MKSLFNYVVLASIIGYPAVLLLVAFGLAPRKVESFAALSLSFIKNKDKPFESSQILPNVYVGTKPKRLQDLEWLKENGMLVTVTLLEEREVIIPHDSFAKYGIRQLSISVADYSAPTFDQIKLGVDFVEMETDKSPKAKIYIHCNGGKGRSATLAIAYIMKLNNWALEKTYEFVKKKRKISNLNMWQGIRPQWRVLKQWETHLSTTTNRRKKR